MTIAEFRGVELLPQIGVPRQLFILLHGVGASSSDLVPLALQFNDAFPDAAFLIPDGVAPFDGGGNGRQWFSISDITEENRITRVAEAMPALHDIVQRAQQRLGILQTDTALVGFSQGAIMAMEYAIAHDGGAGRVIAFSGRFAKLPDKAPEFTTLHLLHGVDDRVIPVAHAYAAYQRLTELQGDATIDVASKVGHELHPALIARAIRRLQTCVPLRSWKQALNDAGGV